MPQAEIIFCGKSLYISGLAAGIQSDRNYHVIRLESPICSINEEIKMLHPDLVVFEQNESSDEDVQRFMESYSDICLVGVKPEDDTLTVFYKEGNHVAPVDRLHLFMKVKGVFCN